MLYIQLRLQNHNLNSIENKAYQTKYLSNFICYKFLRKFRAIRNFESFIHSLELIIGK